jgi:hypothetical protein
METREQLEVAAGGALASERLAALALRPLFTVEGVTYHWGDVLDRARARGSLAEVEHTARRGAACMRRAEAVGDALDPETVRGAATRFRYERGLLSAEELNAWLERWGLTVAEWGMHLERSLLLTRWLGELEVIVGEFAPELGAIDEAVYVDAVCSGFLEQEASDLAAAAALASLAEGSAVSIDRVDEAAAAARAEAASPVGIEREVARHLLDWTRLDMEMLEVDDQGVAAEAALCVRVDGRSLADVAAECGMPVRRARTYLGDEEAGLGVALLAAQPGDLIGPIEHEDAFVLLAIHARIPPAADDPELRLRAETMLIDRAVERAIEARVEWE